MKQFDYVRPATVTEAVAAAAQPGAVYLAAGTNLLDLMKGGVSRPDRLVDVTHLDGLDQIETLADGSLRIGALVSNADLAHDANFAKSYPAVAEALLSGASAQLRNAATVGGNLLQRTRCAYFYDTASRCNKREAGTGCDARDGENRGHAVLGWSESCIATHPSDFCVPLAALDAVVEIEGRNGRREIALEELHRLPGNTPERESALEPGDLWRWDTNGKSTRLTNANAAKLAGVDMPQVTRFNFKGANGDTVWGIAMRPAGLAPAAKAPAVLLVHGGPQGSFGDSWSFRWNPAVWTGHGYATVSVDFHGSTGYGQGFTDAINKDWGGKPLTDLKNGLKAATDRFDYIDAENVCAAGGSYGGYMMNWIEGNWPDRFKCIVQHDGVFDARAMAYETEELWFDEYEHGGHPYYEAAAEYERWNPVNFVDKWKTPQLVITSEKDFRIPYTQGLAAFTALQRREIPSRLVIFPDENHWVLKPKNSLQWHSEVFGWLDKWTGGAK